MGYTMAEKILMKNTGLSHLAPGDLIMTRPDMCMVHDIYTPFVVQKLDEMKFRRLADPEKAVIFLDHLCPTNQATGDPRHYHKGHELSDRFGIRKLHAGEGISHTLMHEYRYALPGTVVVATDSHTPTYGGGGCFCTGIGYTEMAATLGSGEMWMKVPEAIRITVEGELPAGVYAKDIVLQVLKDLRSDGGTYKSLEYVGSTIDALDMSGRYTIANMSLEAGCKTALFAADQKTADYFDLPLEKISWIHPDPDAHYVRELYYRAEELVPYLSCPQGVDNVHSIEEVQGAPLNEVYIGSCTNGSLEDMAVAARILQGHHVAPYPDVQLTNLLVDKAAMELTCNPSRFDVMLTTSIFGDILSDEAGVATGSVGMLASAAINENGFGLFEPIHGTAPDIAGLGIANPLAAIASAGMLLEIGLGLKEEAAAIDRAINEVLHLGYRTPDIYLEGRGLTKVTTEEMGRLTAEHIHR